MLVRLSNDYPSVLYHVRDNLQPQSTPVITHFNGKASMSVVSFVSGYAIAVFHCLAFYEKVFSYSNLRAIVQETFEERNVTSAGGVTNCVTPSPVEQRHIGATLAKMGESQKKR